MGDRRRRKSLSIFKPSLSALAPIRDSSSPPENAGRPGVLKKKLRPSSLISPPSSTASSPLPLKRADSDASQQSMPSPALKGRPHSKASRPSSIFGSIKSIHSLHSLADDESAGNSTTRTSWGTQVDGEPTMAPENMVLLHHGEVQLGGGMFRKKNQYLVLTETHLVRFKSQSKAEDVFPNLTPPSSSGSESNRHLRKGSNSSNVEISSDDLSTIPVRQIVAIYKLDDGRPYFTVEIAHLDEATNVASTLTMQLHDPQEAETWLNTLKGAVIKARATGEFAYSRQAVEYVARTLENEGDYDPLHFQMYTAVQRATKSGARSSSDDLGKLLSNICYLVVGLYKIHLVPLLRPTKSSSSTSISDISGSSYGLAALSQVHLSGSDDSFQLNFRLPLQNHVSLHLASACVDEIAYSVKQACEHIRPLWFEQPLNWSSPPSPPHPPSPAPTEFEDNLGFDRTLTAYCIAYKLDPSNIRYTVDYYVEDAPQFQLLQPADVSTRPNYSSLELLSILRALRYNDSFNSLSFKGVKLDSLHALVDRFGHEHLCWTTKAGQPLDRPNAEKLSLLMQEVQNLAVQNERLRRLNFSDALTSKKNDPRYMERGSTELVEALMPLCSQRLTNVDWIILNGLTLSDLDISCLYSAMLKRSCEFRAVEMGGCGLSYDGLRVVSEGMTYQAKTIECINIANAAWKIEERFVEDLGIFKNLRSLDLSNCTPAEGRAALLPFSTLISWRLEGLKLSGTALSQSTIDDLAAYLMDAQSSNLRELFMDSCQLNGQEIAIILQALSADREEPRKLHLDVSKNRISRDQHGKIVSQIAKSATPEALAIRSLEYSNEADFRSLLAAIVKNKSLKFLDMSSVSLPFDADEETCDVLKKLFEENDVLEELNISGETAHLEAATIGKGLPEALKGLSKNSTLRSLHCQYQQLGLPGAAALASVLEQNCTLQELYCDNNEITLQAFTAILNALQRNTTLVYLPAMEHDRAAHTAKTNREVSAILGGAPLSREPSATSSFVSSSKSTLKRSVSGLTSHVRPSNARGSSSRSVNSNRSGSSATSGFRPSLSHNNSQSSSHSSHGSTLAASGYTEQDLTAAVSKLDEQWDAETTRLLAYLHRNACLTQGLYPADGPESEGRAAADMTAQEAGYFLPPIAENGTSRPQTAGSLAAALVKASLDRTPTLELNRQLGLDVGDGSSSPDSLVDGTAIESGGSSPSDSDNALMDTPVQGDFGSALRDDDEGLVMGGK